MIRLAPLALTLMLLSPPLLWTSPAAAQAGPAERAAARGLLDKGKQAFKAKRYEEAAELFLQAYRADPSLKTGLYNRAFALRKANKLPEARLAYLEYIAVSPNDNDGLFGLAETERLLGNKPEALRLFTEYLRREKRPSKEKYVAYAKNKVDQLKVAEASTDPAAEHLTAGNAAYRQGRFEEAAVAFGKAFAADNKQTDALYRQALSYRKAKNHKQAVASYRRLLELDPANLDALFGLAETERLMGNGAAAKELFGKYVAKERRSSRDKYLAYAKKQLEVLGAASPTSPKAGEANKLFEQGLAAYKAKRFKEAAALFQKAHDADASRHDALYRRGLALRKANDLKGAVAAYGAYVQAQPEDPDGHYGLAETHRLGNEVVAARKHFELYVGLEKRPSEAKYVQKARDYLERTKDDPAVLAAAKKAAEEGEGDAKQEGDKTAKADDPSKGEHADDDHDDDGDHAGHKHVRRKDAPKGDAGAESHRNLGPDRDLHSSAFAQKVTVNGLLEHGRSALAAGDNDRAQRHFALAVALDPQDPAARLLLGRAFEAQEKSDRAEAEYEMALELTGGEGPIADEAKRHLAQARRPTRAPGAPYVHPRRQQRSQQALQEAEELAGSKDYDGALERLERAVEQDPGNMQAYLLTGEVYLKRKSGVRALKAYQRALALSPSSAAPLWGLARAYELSGEKRVALHHYRLYAKSKADDVDKAKQREAWLKVEGVEWPLGGS